jgi:hypothetical protein
VTEESRHAAPGHDLVRPFVMTGGRTRSRRTDLRVETLVQRRGTQVPVTLPAEQRALLDHSEQPVSVAELAAGLGLVVGVACVLVNDLLDAGLIEVFDSDAANIDLDTLNAMVNKIRSL